ncbi:MAG: hypothetical protein UV48_C0025G0002 [Candidatus Azambacteria bacterium GW2011_GWA2_42_9]|uniref:Uncharacterized protein n=1 Tax=Candidatus Azambacteria bacterium GW2011_GWA2_42_9 TaxID=1618613 RepID=A0A0G1BNT7_9BACT|nr:MAG: hypothetical protein UV48_C0025G0002 [Candidatus Azambacteria bacterium GW2011_GWA2_42_9]
MIEGEKPTPIGAGEQIRISNSLDRIKGMSKGLNELVQRIGMLIQGKDDLLKNEWQKPEMERNYSLIAALEDELEKLDQAINDAIDISVKLQEGESKLRERFLDIEKRMRTRGY